MAFDLRAQLRLQAPPLADVARVIARVNAQLARGLHGNINVSISGAQLHAAQAMGTALKNIGTQAKSSSTSVKNFGEQMGLAARRYSAFAIAAGGFIKLISAFKSSLTDALKFNRELIKIVQVTGETTVGLGRLTSAIGKLSTSLGVDSEKLLETSRVLSQTGLTADQTRVALEALAKASLAPTFGDITKTVEVAVASMRQFNLEAGDLEGTLGSINAISKSFAVESNDLGVAIQRAGGAFAATGGQLNELLALFTSVRATTRESAESIATGFRTIFTRLQRVRTLNFLEDLGVDLRNAEGNFIGGFKAIEKLSDALSTLDTTDPRFGKIIEELGGFRQVSKVIPLVQQFGLAQSALNVGIRGTASLSKDAETAQQALSVQIAKVNEQFQELIRTFANSTSFKAILDITLRLAQALIKVGDAIQPIVPALLAIGVGAAVKNVGSISANVSGFRSAFLHRAEGGDVPGTGSGDTVPAMLTPGEFVLKKSAVQSIGSSKLHHINQKGVKGFNKGGLVGGGALTGGGVVQSVGPAGFAAAIGAAAGLASTFESLNDGVRTAAVAVATAAAQFFLFRGLGNSLATTSKNTATLARSTQILNAAIKQEAAASERLTIAKYNEEAAAAQRAANPGDANAIANDIAAKQVLKDTKNNQKEAQRHIKLQQNTQNTVNRRIQKFGSRIAGATALIGGLGVALTSFGLRQLEAGDAENGRTLLAGGGALTGAAAGGALGAKLGPIGAVTGAIVGGGIGIAQALDKAKGIIEGQEVTKSIGKFTGALNEFTEGRVSATNQVGKLLSTVSTLQGQIVSVGSEARKTLLAQVKGQTGDISNFLNALAASSDSLEDFKNKAQGLDEFFTDISGQDIDGFEESIRKTIEITKKKQEADARYTAAQIQNIERLRNIGRIDSAINNLQLSMNNLITPIDGATKGFELLDQSKVLDNLSSTDTSLIEEATRNISRNFGAAGQTLAAEVVGVSKTFKALPEILLNIQAQGGLSAGGNFQKKLNAALSDVPESIRETINNRVREIIGADANDGKLLKRIETDLPGLVDELLDGFGNISESLKTQFNLINSESGRLQGLLQQRSDLERKYTESLIKITDERIAGERRIAEATGERVQSGRLQQFDANQFRNLTSGLNVGERAVSDLGRVIISAKENIKNLDKQLNQLDAQKLLEQQTARQGELDKIQQATTALEFLADGASRAAPALEELSKVQEDRKAIFDILKEFTFGDTSSRRDLGRSIASAVAVSQGGIGAVPAGVRGDALSVLERLGDQRLDILGGRSGRDVVNDTVRQQFQGTLSDKDIDALIKGGDKEKELINTIANASAQAISASATLADTVGQSILSLSNFLVDSNRRFLDGLAYTLANANAQTLKAQLDTAEAQKESARNAGNAADTLANLEITTKEDATKALATIDVLGKLAENAKSFEPSQGAAKLLQPGGIFKTLKDLARTRGGLEGSDFAIRNDVLSEGAAREVFAGLRKELVDAGLNRQQASDVIQRTQSGLDSPTINNIASKLVGFRTVQGIGSRTNALGVQTEAATSGVLFDVAKELRTGSENEQKELTSTLEKLDPSRDQLVALRDPVIAGIVTSAIKTVGGDPQKARETLEANTAATDRLTKIYEAAAKAVPLKPDNKDAALAVQAVLVGLGAIGLNRGGRVPGSGNRDTVPALLTPGEIVIPSDQVDSLDPRLVAALLNGDIQKYATGGFVSSRQRRLLEARRKRQAQQQAKREERAREREAFRTRNDPPPQLPLALPSPQLSTSLKSATEALRKPLGFSTPASSTANKAINEFKARQANKGETEASKRLKRVLADRDAKAASGELSPTQKRILELKNERKEKTPAKLRLERLLAKRDQPTPITPEPDPIGGPSSIGFKPNLFPSTQGPLPPKKGLPPVPPARPPEIPVPTTQQAKPFRNNNDPRFEQIRQNQAASKVTAEQERETIQNFKPTLGVQAFNANRFARGLYGAGKGLQNKLNDRETFAEKARKAALQRRNKEQFGKPFDINNPPIDPILQASEERALLQRNKAKFGSPVNTTTDFTELPRKPRLNINTPTLGAGIDRAEIDPNNRRALELQRRNKERFGEPSNDPVKRFNDNTRVGGQAFFNPGQDVIPESSAASRTNNPRTIQESNDIINSRERGVPGGESFDASVTKFASAAQELGKSLAAFPSQITMTGTHDLNVNLNGGEVLASIQPSIEKLVLASIQTNIDNLIKDKFPKVGGGFIAEAPAGLVPSQRSVAANPDK